MKHVIKDMVRASLNLLTENRVKFDIPVPADILKIKDVFEKHGHKLYIVGGAVRDSLLHKKIKDYDLATDALPDKVEDMVNQAGYKTLPTGKAFGVINAFTETGQYEIATFREDIGIGRRPDSVKFTTIDNDVKRRDLTINALFYDIDAGEIVDLVGGIEDLNKGIVRTVGKAEERFGEDRLRIMRAVRFAGRFGSNLDSAVDAALKNDSSLEGVSPERIHDELLNGIISAKSVVHFLNTLNRYNLFHWIFKGLHVTHEFIEDKDPIIVIATLLKGNDTRTLLKTLIETLKYKKEEAKPIVFLIALLKLSPETAVNLKRQQETSNASVDQIENFLRRQGMKSNLIDAFIHFKFTVSAEELMEKGFKNADLGKKLHAMETDNFIKLL